MQEAGKVVNSIDTNLRQAIFNLRMKPAEGGNFTKRIENWIEQWSTVAGVETSSEIAVEEGYFSSAEEVHLFGIIQEAYTNIRKHANAENARLFLHTNGDNWELTVEDDGVGFSVNEIHSRHYGLNMLEERVNKLGAFLDIISGEMQGTKIIVKGVKRP